MCVVSKQEVPKAVLQRLPRYYRNICELKMEDVQRISSRSLAERMGLTASQIRQDFNCFGGFGQQGYGYNVDKLLEELGTILGLNSGRTAILIGVGNMGRALLNNFDFEASGFKMLRAFDSSPGIIGQRFGSYEVHGTKELPGFIKLNRPDVAVLTLPRTYALGIAQSLVEYGVRGLWNFTGDDLHLDGLGVPVENVHLSDSLMTLCHLVEREQGERD